LVIHFGYGKQQAPQRTPQQKQDEEESCTQSENHCPAKAVEPASHIWQESASGSQEESFLEIYDERYSQP